ncbi:hypothetical protein CALCODRAFT_537851, partial [Calocera cornea HHB12733]
MAISDFGNLTLPLPPNDSRLEVHRRIGILKARLTKAEWDTILSREPTAAKTALIRQGEEALRQYVISGLSLTQEESLPAHFNYGNGRICILPAPYIIAIGIDLSLTEYLGDTTISSAEFLELTLSYVGAANGALHMADIAGPQLDLVLSALLLSEPKIEPLEPIQIGEALENVVVKREEEERAGTMKSKSSGGCARELKGICRDQEMWANAKREAAKREAEREAARREAALERMYKLSLIVSAVCITAPSSYDSYKINVVTALRSLFACGLRGQEAFPTLTVEPSLVADCVQGGEGTPSPMLAVTPLPLEKLRSHLEKTNKHQAENSRSSSLPPPRGLCGIVNNLRKIKIKYTDDQMQDPSLRTIDILSTTAFTAPARITTQLVLLLPENGVPNNVLVDLM